METRFTKGPWKVQDAGPNSGNVIRIEIVEENDFVVCEIEDSAIDNSLRMSSKVIAAQKRDVANAHLIAAAPEMYAILEEVEAYALKLAKDDAPGVAPDWYGEVRDILKKARGGQ